MSELLPCPFCGGKAFADGEHSWWQVACNNCGAVVDNMGENYSTEENADKAWNTRHQPEVNDVALAIMKEGK